MKDRYLEVTFRHGEPLAAYLYLPRSSSTKSARTENVADGLLVDFDEEGEPIGIEILSPGQLKPEDLNEILERLHQPRLEPDELSPVAA